MLLNCSLINLVYGAALVFSGPVWAKDPNLGAVLNLAYGSNDGPDFNYSEDRILRLIQKVQPSAVVPFLLNVEPESLGQYSRVLTELKNSGIKVYPAIGDHKRTPDITDYKASVAAYIKYTDCIQLDQVSAYIDQTSTGIKGLKDFIHYLNVTLGYQHIMLNAWPKKESKVDYTFDNPAVDSAIEQVQYSATSGNDTNWTPNEERYNRILAAQKGVTILSNYENPPEERVLARLETNQQLQAFQTTINAIKKDFPNGNVHWTAPWSKNYDPVTNGTYKFYVKQLSSGNP